MADCGWLSLRCGSSIQRDMDSCPSASSGVTRNHLTTWQTGNGPRASSCLSSTMVEHNDPDDSGSSQARTPARTPVDSKQSVIRDRSLPQHELELSISSPNDAQRGPPVTPLRLRSVKDEFDPISPNPMREDTVGGSACAVEEETSLLDPPRKRARMSPLGLRLEDSASHALGLAREQPQVLQRHPSQSVSLSATSEVTGLANVTPSRSLPSFRSGDSDPSPSSSRATAGPGPRGSPTISWWLGHGLRTPSAVMVHSEGPKHPPYQSVEESGRANFAVDGRGLIPGTTLQERELGASSTKQPSFFPNMLSSMETSEHANRRSEELPAGVVGAKTSVIQEHGRPQIFLDRPHEHSFLRQKDTTTTSRASNISTMSDETVPRSGYPISGKNSSLREAAPSRESFQDHAAGIYGQQQQQQQQPPSSCEGGRTSGPVPGPRRHPSAPESQQALLEREPPPPPQHYGLSRQQVVDQQRTMFGPSGGNANTTFYAKILDAAQAQQPASSGPFSQAGFASAFNVNKSVGLNFNLAAQTLSRASSQAVTVPDHIQFGSEGATSNVVQQQSNNDVLRGLVAANPNIGPISPFISQVHNPGPDAGRLSFPNRTSLDFLQSLQRQSFPSQGVPDRHRPTPQQEYPYLSTAHLHPGTHHQSLSTELNPPPPRPSNLQQTPSGLRDFLSPPRVPKVAPFGGIGPRGSVGGGSTSLEIPAHLSLQAAAPPSLTVSMEGRAIVRRIGLQDYDGYDSFATALRSMFNSQVSTEEPRAFGETCTLANAISGYVIAYEDEEGDILLAGDLPWRDFVRAAKQIKIVSSSKISFQPPAGTMNIF